MYKQRTVYFLLTLNIVRENFVIIHIYAIIKLSDEFESKFKEDINNWEGGMMITYEKEIENKAIIKVAKNLIKLGVSLEKIKKATNLPEETIKKLQEEANK